MNDLKLTEQQVEAYTLFEIESIMLKMGKSLKDIDGMPLPNPSLIRDLVLPVATSDIAALLLPNVRTAHSRFHIPLNVTVESTCEIQQGTLLVGLLVKTSLIIWDEALMANKFCFEALDKTSRDILRTRFENKTNKPFGGLTIVCGGDF
ncbi:uncharacterized protein LOC133833654 [Humulus lupulus]|uniref:uncharacterized protein LOC133833654 n=1 Tax=Humulus lupulus TaxID=3486 RepID=UPI002B404B70|nr:uncharacterized protein LOC133833654 [Humulus lupulus]